MKKCLNAYLAYTFTGTYDKVVVITRAFDSVYPFTNFESVHTSLNRNKSSF